MVHQVGMQAPQHRRRQIRLVGDHIAVQLGKGLVQDGANVGDRIWMRGLVFGLLGGCPFGPSGGLHSGIDERDAHTVPLRCVLSFPLVFNRAAAGKADNLSIEAQRRWFGLSDQSPQFCAALRSEKAVRILACGRVGDVYADTCE